MDSALQNSKIYRIITNEAKRRGYMDELNDVNSSKLPMQQRHRAYYEKRIRPYQSIETPLERRDSSLRKSAHFVDEKQLQEFTKNQKITWYMSRFIQLEEEENKQRQDMIKVQEQKRKYYLEQIKLQNERKIQLKLLSKMGQPPPNEEDSLEVNINANTLFDESFT